VQRLLDAGLRFEYVPIDICRQSVLDLAASFQCRFDGSLRMRGIVAEYFDGLPVVLLSAGVSVTPVIAMLHALAAHASPRPVWWIYGARNRLDHPFAREARDLLTTLPHARSYVQYSRPDATDRLGVCFDAAGRLGDRGWLQSKFLMDML